MCTCVDLVFNIHQNLWLKYTKGCLWGIRTWFLAATISFSSTLDLSGVGFKLKLRSACLPTSQCFTSAWTSMRQIAVQTEPDSHVRECLKVVQLQPLWSTFKMCYRQLQTELWSLVTSSAFGCELVSMVCRWHSLQAAAEPLSTYMQQLAGFALLPAKVQWVCCAMWCSLCNSGWT